MPRMIILILTALASLTNASLNPLSIGLRSAIARRPLAGINSHRRSSTGALKKQCRSPPKQDEYPTTQQSIRGGDAKSNVTTLPITDRRLHFWEAMVCGAISRSMAQTIMHPANTMKTMLQSSRQAVAGAQPLTIRSFAQWEYTRQLSRGVGAQLLLSIPHGAVNFAVLEFVRRQMNNLITLSPYATVINKSFGAGMDFISSAISTVCCSVVSTPQMMICDNIMAGTYPNLVQATAGLMKDKGLKGFYTGWWPGIAGKIPSYGLTWTLFEQIKRIRSTLSDRPARDIENSIMGCMASATTVCIMIPMDTVKTRLVTQFKYSELEQYKGIADCFSRVLKEEGVGAFYRGLWPRLLSVVPMIGIQFGVYEFTKKMMLSKDTNTITPSRRLSKREVKKLDEEAEKERSRRERKIQEMAMEVAADDDQPFPAPYRKKDWWGRLLDKSKKT